MTLLAILQWSTGDIVVMPLFHVFYVHLPVVWCENKPISSHNSLVFVVFPEVKRITEKNTGK